MRSFPVLLYAFTITIMMQAHASSTDTTGEAEVLIDKAGELPDTSSCTSRLRMAVPLQTRLAQASRRLHGALQRTNLPLFSCVSGLLGLLFILVVYAIFNNLVCSLSAASLINCLLAVKLIWLPVEDMAD